jgi:hypothetical protein
VEHARFWSLIDDARAATGRTSAMLARALAKLPPAEIMQFDAWFSAYYSATRREDLWCAVYAIRGGCGDDSFDYFRAWLVSRGEAALLAAVRDPESLADLIGGDDPRDESMLGAARDAYREVTGEDLPEHAIRPQIPDRDTWPTDRIPPRTKWTDDLYAAHFPKLFARYIAPHVDKRPKGAIPCFAAARDRASTIEFAAFTLRRDLVSLPAAEVIGFARWMSAYNHALMRADLAIVARLLSGKRNVETVAGLRGWLIGQGEPAVRATVRDPNAILDHAKHPLAPCTQIIFATDDAQRAHELYLGAISDDERELIPDRAEWRPDLTAPLTTLAALRAHFPRLTAKMPDTRLELLVDRVPEKRAAEPPAAMRVSHATFGEGVVVATITTGPEPKLVVDFPSGRRTIAKRFLVVTG